LEIDAFNAAALHKLSQREQTKASVTSAHSSHEPNVETAESCQCVSDLRRSNSLAVSTDCQQPPVTLPSSAAASSSSSSVAAAAAATSTSLSQLENDLDALLSV